MDHCMRDLYFYTRLSGYFPSFDRNCALIWSGGTSSDRKRETDQSVLRDFGPLRGRPQFPRFYNINSFELKFGTDTKFNPQNRKKILL